MSTDQHALVIGATGGIGGEVALALSARGWRVTALNRQPERARAKNPRLAGLDWVRGDIYVPEDVVRAAQGARLIVHGANTPGYAQWAQKQPAMLESVIGAAKATGARILMPGSVYNFGPDAWPRLTETSPQHPRTRKGAIRVALEQRLAQAAGEGVRSLMVRAGDFFGPVTESSWLTEGWVQKGRPLRAVTFPGPGDAVHAWAYLPDVAQSMVRLAERAADLAPFDVFHHRGHELSGDQLAEALDRIAGRRLARKTLPWIGVAAAAPFVEMLREMLEMRYLWRETIVLDNAKLTGLLGEEPHTPLDQALRRTLEGHGCLPLPAARAA